MSRPKLIFKSIFFIILVIALSNIAIIIKDIVEVYNFKFSLLTKDILLSHLFNANTYISFFTDIHPVNALGWFIIGIYVVFSILNNFSTIANQKKYTQKDTYGSHGTARFQTKKEISANYSKDKLGWFMGSIKSNQLYKIGMEGVYHKLNGNLNMQMTVIGSPGSNKTTGFVLPNIFHIPYIYKKLNNGEMPDFIVTDPKSELFSLTANYLEEQGYSVRVLDFIHLKYGDTLNPLNFISNDKELMEIADGYISSIEFSQGGGSKDKFWAEQESQVLGALIGFIKQTRPSEKQTFSEVMKVLTSDDVSSIDKAKELFLKYNIKGAPKQLWDNFLMISDSERTRANILGGLATKLKLFSIDGVQNITNSTTIDITRLGSKRNKGEKPIALFIFMPDKDRTFAPIINVTVTTILNQLYKTAYEYDNKLINPIYLILEEMANIGKLSGIQQMLGTMRGRRIYPMMIWQSLSQMKDRYKDGWEDILSMCDTHVYLGINDEFTAKYCSNALGNTTIRTQGVTRSPKGLGIESKSESQSYSSRKLMFPEEVKSLENTKMIISQRAYNPIFLNKVQYKYWEEDKKICDFKKVIELNLINTFSDIDESETVNVNIFTSTDKEIKSKKINKEIEKEDIMNIKSDIISQGEVISSTDAENFNPFISKENTKNNKEYNPFNR